MPLSHDIISRLSLSLDIVPSLLSLRLFLDSEATPHFPTVASSHLHRRDTVPPLTSGKGAVFQHACYRCQHACYCPNMRFCKNHMSTCVAEFYMMLQNSNMHVAKFQHGVSNIRTWRFKTPNMHVTDMNINVTDTSMHVTDANMGKSQFI